MEAVESNGGRAPSPFGCATAGELIDRMVELRRWVGQPSLRRLRQLGGTTRALDGSVIDALPPTTVSAFLRGRRGTKLPRLVFVEAFVTACLTAAGVDAEVGSAGLERWREVWRVLAGSETTNGARRPVPELGAGPRRESMPADAVTGPCDDQVDPPVPRQLPMPVSGFCGRRAELTRLDGCMSALGRGGTGPTVISVTGPGGNGKTALALAWAHRVVERFPAGQLHAELGHGTAPHQVLGRFVRALGAEPVGDELELAAQFRTLVADRRMLLVLDDAQSSQQVRPLLPGTRGSLVLVTSRNDLCGLSVREGAIRLPLERLDEREALQLVSSCFARAQIRVDEDLCRRLATECEGWPRGLRIGADRLIRVWS